MELSQQQGRAAQAVTIWLRDPSTPQVFRLFGGAGTGKTSIARVLVEDVSGEVYFGTFTGKAAYVLRTKGVHNATTLHKLIYTPKSKSAARLRELEEELEKLELTRPPDRVDPALERRISELRAKVDDEHRNVSRPAFALNSESPLRHAKLLVVDEVSMVDEQMGRDLESFGCKILVLGDPNQLPPVYGTGYFTQQEPDFLLTEIHRQARDNPIIQLAAMIRDGEMPRPGVYGESRVLKAMDASIALDADQMLVGRNETRNGFNRRVRQLRGFESALPVVGDKLVCLRNSMEHPLLNGSTWRVEVVQDVNEHTLTLGVRDGEGTSVACLAHKAHFLGERVPFWARNDAEEFDYGNALTVHKAQGSQWDHVLVYDESWVFRADRWRWLYTGVTRAAQRVDLVRVG